MLQRAGLEGVGADLDGRTCDRQLPGDGDLAGTLDVPSQIRDRHAAFACFLIAARLSQLGIHQDDQSMTGPRLAVVGDVYAEGLGGNPDLWCREPDTTRRQAHGGYQIRAQLDHLLFGRIDPLAGDGQDMVRSTYDISNTPDGQRR